MASQQTMQSGKQQDIIPVPLVDTRGEVSNRRNSARPQPLLQQLIDLDQNLLKASGMLDGARKALYGHKIALNTSTKKCWAFEQAYYEEHQNRIACAEAYEKLYAQHQGALNDLNEMSGKCLSLHRDLEDAQTAMLALESTIQQQERSSNGKDISDASKDCGFSQSDWDRVEQGISNEQLEARIRELEDDKSKMMREHENALIEATKQIYAAKQETNDLAKMYQTASPSQVGPSASGKVGKASENGSEAGSRQQGGRAKRGRKPKQPLKLEPCSL